MMSSSGDDGVVVVEGSRNCTQADQDIAIEKLLRSNGIGSAEVALVDDDDSRIVPVIDISNTNNSDDCAHVAAQLWDAATNVGFFTVIGHGIDTTIIDDAFHVSATYFDQSIDEKVKQSPFDVTKNSGYEYFSQIRPSTGVADQKESIQITARYGCMDNRWPNDNFKNKATALLDASHNLACRLLNLLQLNNAIPHASSSTEIADSHTLWSDDGQCTLRMLHYPPVPKDVTEKLLADGYWRAGPHTDWCNLTLLYQRVGQSGLECCANPRLVTTSNETIKWTAVNPVPNGIAVNIGDMLARWSDGKLHSNLHRVRLPIDATKSRYSIAFFAQSDKKTLIQCNESEPITAGDYILSRIRSNFDSK